MFRRELVLQLLIVNDPSCFRVDQKHSAWLQSSLQQNAIGRNVEHANLGSHNHEVVLRYVVARWPQTVAVQHRGDPCAVRESD